MWVAKLVVACGKSSLVMIADAGVRGAQRASKMPDHALAAAAACNVHRLADMTELVTCQQLEVNI